MNQFDDMEATRETARLLSELDDALDYSSALREILDKYEQLSSLERVTGPSRFTRLLRQQIRNLEDRLGAASA
jgi:hypothetical protein